MNRRLRTRLALEAARYLREGREQDYVRAKRLAARRLGVRFRPVDLPSNREVRDQLAQFERWSQTPGPVSPRTRDLEVLRLLRELRPWGALAILGATAEEDPHIRCFCDDGQVVVKTLTQHGWCCHREPARPLSDGGSCQSLVIDSPLVVRLLIFPTDWRSMGRRCLATGSLLDGVDAAQLAEMLRLNPSAPDIEEELLGLEGNADRFEVYRFLLWQLENAAVCCRTHPNADALHHSLQLFDLACRERPYDEEFLTAALLHDVGKAVDPSDPMPQSLALLDGVITRRTRWLLEHWDDASAHRDRELDPAQHRQLAAMADWEDVLLLEELDRRAVVAGAAATGIDEAVDYLSRLDSGDAW